MRDSVEPPKLKRRERERKKRKNGVLPHKTAANQALAKTGLVEKSI